jgi:hypothetical protein
MHAWTQRLLRKIKNPTAQHMLLSHPETARNNYNRRADVP